MKRMLAFILSLLLCVPAALAEADGYWTSNADWYYHLSPYCGGAENMVPISLDGAEAFGKYPCPVCVPEEDGSAEVRAVTRGGVVIARVPDAWLDSVALSDPNDSFFTDEETFSGAEAQQELAALLHGEAYVRFVEQVHSGDSVEIRARGPQVGADPDFEFSKRHLGGAWYFVVLPRESVDRWDTYMGVWGAQLRMEGDVLHKIRDQQNLASNGALRLGPIARADGAECVYARTEGMKIDVYRAQDMNIAVFSQRAEDVNRLSGARLYIGGVDTGAILNGRRDGDAGTYCCVLTEAELAALRSGAEVELRRAALAEIADSADAPYAVVDTDAGPALIDREGNYVIEPGRYNVSQPYRQFYPTTAALPIICMDGKGNTAVLNGETLDVVVKLSREYTYVEYINPAVLLTATEDVNQWRSMADGSVLFERSSSWDYVDGHYVVMTDGSPERLVMKSEAQAPDTRAWLADNRGNRVSDAEYQLLTPLIWWQGKGVFLAESYDPTAYPEQGDDDMQISFALEYLHGEGPHTVYAGTRYGPGWRCGLIDQDGNVLAEVKYTSFEVLEGGAFRLGTEDGGYETVTPVPIPAGQ